MREKKETDKRRKGIMEMKKIRNNGTERNAGKEETGLSYSRNSVRKEREWWLHILKR